MAVDTAKVRGRRALRFGQLDEILAEADRLAAIRTRSLGNWSLGQVCQHLAGAMHLSIDGAPPDSPLKTPIWLRILGRFIKRRILTKGMPAGVKLPVDALPALRPVETDQAAATTNLRAAIGRLAREEGRAPHPILGRLSRAEWDQLHLRHAEMHLSFIQPEQESA
jgi:hypothetical protein